MMSCAHALRKYGSAMLLTVTALSLAACHSVDDGCSGKAACLSLSLSSTDVSHLDSLRLVVSPAGTLTAAAGVRTNLRLPVTLQLPLSAVSATTGHVSIAAEATASGRALSSPAATLLFDAREQAAVALTLSFDGAPGGGADGAADSDGGAGGSGTGGGGASGSGGGGAGGSGTGGAGGSGTGGGGAGGMGTPTLSLLAGGLGGTGFADGVGSAARFNGLTGLTSDGAGGFYLVDANNCVIRHFAPATGAVTTLAGSAGHCGHVDGVGSAAQLSTPQDIVGDGAGHLFVTDYGVSAVRRVDIASATVSTLVQTSAALPLGRLAGIARDGAGHLFVADNHESAIYQVDAGSGALTTLAGGKLFGYVDGVGTAAELNGPVGLACDGAGNLYVADSNNSLIRKIVIASGAVTTLAGAYPGGPVGDGVGRAASFDRPSGLTSDGAGNLYVLDSLGHTVRQIVLASATVSTLAGSSGGGPAVDGNGAAARFSQAGAVASDGAGDLYLGDLGALRKLVLAGDVVTTVAGSLSQPTITDGTGAAARFGYLPGGFASDGTVAYVTDSSRLRRVVLASGVVTTLSGNFDSPVGLALDGAGNLYIAEESSNVIQQLTLSTGVVTTLAGTAGQSGSSDGSGAAARFNAPTGLALDGAGNLYVADSGNATIRRIVLAGAAVTTLAGSAGVAGSSDGQGAAALFYSPQGLIADGAGSLYIADSRNNSIRRLSLASGVVTTLAGSAVGSGSADGVGAAARFDLPLGLALDGAGSLYVADLLNHTVRRVALATAAVTTFVGRPDRQVITLGALPASLNSPTGLLFTGGQLLIADAGEGALLAVH